MKSSPPQDPTRWRDRGAEAHALESRAAVLVDATAAVSPLGPQAVSRIRTRVLARRSTGGRVDLRRLTVRARLAFAIGLVLVCVTTAGGASMIWRKYVSSAGRAAPPPVEKSARQIPRRVSRVSSRSNDPATPLPSRDEAPEQPAAAPAPEALVLSAPTRSRGAGDGQPSPVSPRAAAPDRSFPSPPRSSPAMATRTPEPPEPLPSLADAPAQTPQAKATEAGLVAEALSDLRQRNDPRGALSTLDRYAQEFPHGVLETEALRTRVEAVIQLDDLKTALALLDGKSVLTEGLGPDLQLTRAELRAAAGRFREALADFNQVVDSAAGPLVAGGDERALYGRAVCLGRLAQDERARVDLLAYQRRFPNGRFALEVRRLLAGPAPSQHP
jgi:hypothetical protein